MDTSHHRHIHSMLGSIYYTPLSSPVSLRVVIARWSSAVTTATKGSLVPHHLLVYFLIPHDVMIPGIFSFLQGVIDPAVSANAPGLDLRHVEAIQRIGKGMTLVARSSTVVLLLLLFALLLVFFAFKAGKEISIPGGTPGIVGQAGTVLEGFRQVETGLSGPSTDTHAGNGSRFATLSVAVGRRLAVHVSARSFFSSFWFNGKESDAAALVVVAAAAAAAGVAPLVDGEQKGPISVFAICVSAEQARR